MNDASFDILLETADYLQKQKAHEMLMQMKTVYDQKLFFVAFIGQYSSGKSSLLNSLLGRTLLPQGTTETTPLLTFVRYGEQECAKLYCLDGTVKELSLDDVAHIAQQNEGADLELDNLDHLEVFLHEDYLSSGMVLLDTPGINTLISRHEALLADSLSRASSIIYVAGGAPSQVDKDKLAMLTSYGFDITYVRTKCDQIKPQEETVAEVKNKEQAALSENGIHPCQSYYVSNEPASPNFDVIKSLRDNLQRKGSNAQNELEKATEQQLRTLAKQYVNELKEKQKSLSDVVGKNTAELKHKKDEIQKKINRLEERLEIRNAKMEHSISDCISILDGKVMTQLKSIVKQAETSIERDSTIKTEEQMREAMNKETMRFLRQATPLINASIDPLVRQVNGDVKMDALAEEVTLDSFEMPQAENVQELCAVQNSSVVRMQNQLMTLKSNEGILTQKLEEIQDSPEYLQLVHDLQEIQEEYADAQDALQNLSPYIPQLEKVDETQPSDVARFIGKAADWALLLLPGGTIAGGVEKGTKALLGNAKNTKKIARLIGSWEKAGATISKGIKKGDSIKDTLYALSNMSKSYATIGRINKANKLVSGVASGASTTVKAIDSIRTATDEDAQESDNSTLSTVSKALDLFTVEYWFTKIGKQFDHPPRYDINKEVEAQYIEGKKRLTQLVLEKQQKAYQKMAELNAYKTKEEQLLAEQKSNQVDQQDIERQLEAESGRLLKEAEKKAQKNWRKECAEWYCRQMDLHIEEIIANYKQEMPDRIRAYQKQQFSALQDALCKENANLEELINIPADTASLELDKVTALLHQTEVIANG